MNDQENHRQRVSDHYDRLAAHGPFATLAPHNKGGRKGEYIAAVFDTGLLPMFEHAVPYERILDLGCGAGILTRQLAAYAHEIVGTDVSSGMPRQAAEVCHKSRNVLLLQTDRNRIPLPDASVDLTVAREVLCYVSDDDLPSVLNDIHHATKPGGVVLWLDQVSNNPFWQRHPGAPNLIKHNPLSIRACRRGRPEFGIRNRDAFTALSMDLTGVVRTCLMHMDSMTCLLGSRYSQTFSVSPAALVERPVCAQETPR